MSLRLKRLSLLPAVVALAAFAALAPVAVAQTPLAPAPSPLHFAAFSVKWADPSNLAADMGIRIEDSSGNAVCPASNSTRVAVEPTRIHNRYITLRRLILDAYGLQQYQLVGGPDWLDGACFEVDATTEVPADEASMMAMLRNALTDRFGLQLRQDKKMLNVRELRIAPGGIKFKPLQPGEAPPSLAERQGNDVKYGFPSLARLAERISSAGLLANGSPTRQGTGSDEPVVDATGLSGEFAIVVDHIQAYDFPFTGPVLIQELRDQLGLELVRAQRAEPVFTVVAAHEPVPNP